MSGRTNGHSPSPPWGLSTANSLQSPTPDYKPGPRVRCHRLSLSEVQILVWGYLCWAEHSPGESSACQWNTKDTLSSPGRLGEPSQGKEEQAFLGEGGPGCV